MATAQGDRTVRRAAGADRAARRRRPFFDPAVLHGAGTNHTEGERGIKRMGNLLQISSAMGIALEAVDRDRVC